MCLRRKIRKSIQKQLDKKHFYESTINETCISKVSFNELGEKVLNNILVGKEEDDEEEEP